MNICWSPEAAADFAGIIDYIGRENPSAAERVGRSMFDSVHSLESFSNRGRPGRIDGTRELVLAPLPFIESNETPWRSRECYMERNAGRNTMERQ
jgi:toxin ParE1/3/4